MAVEEFRFETLYTTPRIILPRVVIPVFDPYVLGGSQKSRSASFMTPRKSILLANHQRYEACWVLLLSSIHDCALSLGLPGLELSPINIPNFNFRLYASISVPWDFQLPHVVRPLATTPVGVIAIIARRLGMRWKEFRPVDRIMRAEGNGQLTTSTIVRSLGTVIQYLDTEKVARIWQEIPISWIKQFSENYIPAGAADSLGFGRIAHPSPFHLHFPGRHAFFVGTHQQIFSTVRILDPGGECANALQSFYDKDPNYNLWVGDLVAMLTPMVRLSDTTHHSTARSR
jgi:hypothetical protein